MGSRPFHDLLWPKPGSPSAPYVFLVFVLSALIRLLVGGPHFRPVVGFSVSSWAPALGMGLLLIIVPSVRFSGAVVGGPRGPVSLFRHSPFHYSSASMTLGCHVRSRELHQHTGLDSIQYLLLL